MPKKVLMMMMKAAKLGWAGLGAAQKQERGRSMRRAGQEQGRSRAEQSKAEQGRKRAEAGQELAVILGTLKCS